MSTTTIDPVVTDGTIPYRPSRHLQVQKPSSKSFAGSLPGASTHLSEARYWANKFGLGKDGTGSKPMFAHPRKLNLKASSSSVIHEILFGPPAFSKCCPLAVVSGPRVRLYGTTVQSVFHRSLSQHNVDRSATFEDVDEVDTSANVEADRQVQTGGYLALAASYRNDGRLLAVGTDNGQVRIADTTSRATLCTFTSSSKLSVRTVRWFRDGQHILSSGDDGVVRVWLLSSGALTGQHAILELKGHGDAVRTSALWQVPGSKSSGWPYKSLGFTGSYDHSIRIWNLDSLVDSSGTDEDMEDRCIAVLPHGAPVEAILLMPSSDPNVPVWLLSAGGTTVKVWNPLSGVCVKSTPVQHSKTITSLMCFPRKDYDGNEKITRMRIFTAGLDGLLRVHSWNSSNGELDHLHGIKLNVAVTSMAVNEEADRVAIGTVDGVVLVRQRGPSITSQKRKSQPRGGTYAFFTRGMNISPSEGDFVVEAAGKKRRLRKFDIALKRFRYSEALDAALETRNPNTVVAVLEELGRRLGLAAALSNRDEENLEPVLSFTVRYIGRPRFAALLIGVAHKLIDIYGDIAGQSEVIDELFDKLKKRVSAECRMQRMLLPVIGQIEAIMTKAEMDQQDGL